MVGEREEGKKDGSLGSLLNKGLEQKIKKIHD